MKHFAKIALLASGFGLMALILFPVSSRRSTAADDVKTTIIGNLSTNPALVANVDNGAHNAIIGSCSFDNSGACVMSFKSTLSPNLISSIPFGYELVVENLSGSFALPAGDVLFRAYLQTSVNGKSSPAYVVPVKTGTDGVVDYFSFGQTVHLYSDPGGFNFFLGHASANGPTLDQFNISGYLVACGSGSGCPLLP